jgi:ribosomal protein L5
MRLKEQYKTEIAPALMKKFGYKSVMQIPRLEKIVVNVGCGEARDNPKVMEAIHQRPCQDHRPEGSGLQSQKERGQL